MNLIEESITNSINFCLRSIALIIQINYRDSNHKLIVHTNSFVLKSTTLHSAFVTLVDLAQ